jgi:hypothetical protein
MARVFEEVTLTWHGRDYKIPPDQMLRLIAQIEDVVTFGDLAEFSLGRIKLSKLAQAFGLALRAAGCPVDDDTVFSEMFGAKGERAKQIRERAQAAIFALQSLMIPPEHLRGEPAKKPEAAGKRAASSPRRTNSSSARAG